jgi:hypothetical protein
MNHANGSSIIGIVPDREMAHEDFKNFIEPISNCISKANLKFVRKSAPYKGRLGIPCKVFEMLSP